MRTVTLLTYAGIADKSTTTKNFKDNVGTIEVVILRCKDGGGEEVATDPAQTVVSRNPVYTTRAPAVRLPVARAPSARAPSTRAPSVAVKPPPGSIDGFDMMMGIFDGAGDDPSYYKQYRPHSIVGQEHLPGHKWDPSSGQYRYFDDQDPFVNQRDRDNDRYGGSFPAHRYSPQTYTVAGGFSYQESEAPQEERPEGPKVFVPQSSPGYDFSTRRRKAPTQDPNVLPKSTYDFTRSRRSGQHENEMPRRHQDTIRPHQGIEEPSHRQENGRPHYDTEKPRRRRDSDAPQREPGHGSIRPQQEDDKHRRRHDSDRTRQDTEKPRRHYERHRVDQDIDQSRHSAHSRQDPEKPEQPEQPGSGLAFIEYCSQELSRLNEAFNYELDKYIALQEDANRYHVRRSIYDEMLKAARRKYDEVAAIMKNLDEVYATVKQAMDGMNRETWRTASNFLFDSGLYPPPSFQVSPPVELDEEGKVVPPPSKAEDKAETGSGWGGNGSFFQVGAGEVDNNDWGAPAKDNKDDKKSKTSQSKDWTEDKAASNGLDWAGDDDEEKKSDDGWGSTKNTKVSTTKSKGSNMPGGWDNTKPDKTPDTSWDKPKPGSVKAASSWGGKADKAAPRASQPAHSSRSRFTGPVNDGAASDYSLGDPQPKPVIKPYWSEWTKNPVTIKPKVQPREVYEYPALPLPTLPAGKAEKGITQAVHAGRGANYAHKLYRPEYLDSMSKPYAVFTFHYRSKPVLESILRHKIDDSNIGEAKVEAKKHDLYGKTKEELVEALMKKTSVTAAQARAPTKAATNKADDWGVPARKASIVKPSTSHRVSPAVNSWAQEVQPHDSVSQVGPKVGPKAKTISGWGGEAQASVHNSTNKWNDSEQGGKSEACNEASHASRKQDKSGRRNENSKAEWAAGGWGNSAVNGGKSAATHEHFDAAELSGKTGGGNKGFKSMW